MANNANHFGNHAAPELKVNRAGVALQPGVRVGFTRCFTCNNMCGLRYRVDEVTDKITRLAGNPYCEVVTGGAPLPLKTSVAEAYQALCTDSYIIYGIPGFGKCFLEKSEKSEINIFLEKT